MTGSASLPSLALMSSAELGWDAHFLGSYEADAYFRVLREEVPWIQHTVRLFGRVLPAPRLSSWVGDPEAYYTYSSVTHAPQPWTPTLAALRDRINGLLGTRFNSVLANLYRSGQDAMGWHADDEPELGPSPVIASLSLGAPRRFLLRSRDKRERAAIALTHGSLLVMQGQTQARTQHSLPRTARAVGERINLTFRRIGAPATD